MRTLFLWAVLVAAAIVAGGHEHASCAVDENDHSLTCDYRVLTRDVGAVVTDRKVTSLRVRCNRDVLAESVLRANHFGYLAHVKALEVDACKIRRVPALAFSGLTSLTSLSLTSGWSSVAMEVEAEAFTGLHSLRALNLSSNGIRSLSPSVYCSLASLGNFDVSRNAIRDVVSLGFSDQAASKCRLPLDTIDLSGNGFDSVPNGAFAQLFSLKRLNLDANFIATLEERSLSSLIFLQKLSLAHNRLSSLPPLLFSETVSLVELNMQNNSLSVLPPGVLSPLRNLLLLNLSRNALSSDHMDAATFSGLSSLRALDLSFNRLSKIDKHLFSGLDTLEILDLSHNDIRSLSGLSALPRLHSLSLSHNLLQSLSSACGPSLSYLSLDHNILADLSQANCSSLQDLSLSGNRLRRLPAIVRSLPQIKTLDVSQNSIGELRTSDLKDLQHLTALSLASNGISRLDGDVFDALPELEILNLSDNLLDKLNASMLVPLKTLRVLRLDSNLLEDINGLLTTNAQLQVLNVSSNRMAWFDYGSMPRSVRWLDVSRNRLEELGNYFGATGEGYSLEHLLAAHNAIASLGPSNVLDGMQTIDLSHNEIAKVEAHTFEAKTKLRRVMLNDNKLTKLDTSALATRGTSKQQQQPAQFFLARNPFVCDCDMKWLQEINAGPHLRRGLPVVVDLDDVACTPSHQLGREQSLYTDLSLYQSLGTPILQLSEDNFLCQYEAHCFALCQCCDFFACDCRMQCPEGCSCYHDATWSANVIQCSARDHSIIPPLIPMDATAVHLDGNNFTGILESQAFIGRKRVRQLYLNSSKIEAVSNQTFNGLTELRLLHLEDNLIRRLEGYEFSNLTALEELYLHNNQLQFIGRATFSSLASLQVLHLHGNRLSAYPIWELRAIPGLSTLTLSGNPWTCRCDFVSKLHELTSTKMVVDMAEVQCVGDDDRHRSVLAVNLTCSDALPVVTSQGLLHSDAIPVLAGIVTAVVVAVALVTVLCIFRTPLKIWLHWRYGVRLGSARQARPDCQFDAAINYAAKDAAVVKTELADRLEGEPPFYRLCLRHRDAAAVHEEDVNRVSASRVLVISRAFLESEWSGVKYAWRESDSEATPDTILVLLEDLSSLKEAGLLDRHFSALRKSAVATLRFGEPGFWTKLHYYLPDPLPQTCFTPDTMLKQEWAYEAAAPASNHSSASTRSTVMGGSPRPLQLVDAGGGGGGGDAFDHAFGRGQQTYPLYPQAPSPVYQRVDDDQPDVYLGTVNVRLQSGHVVPATLVRRPDGAVVHVIDDLIRFPPQQLSTFSHRHNQNAHLV